MRALFDISPMVRKYSVVPFDRVQLIQNIADFRLSEVRRGIAIIFAAGSGKAVLALQKLTRFLAARDASIELIVIDVESMTTQEMKQTFGREFYGHGETQWIRDGKVVAFLDAFPHAGILVNGSGWALRPCGKHACLTPFGTASLRVYSSSMPAQDLPFDRSYGPLLVGCSAGPILATPILRKLSES